MPGNPLNEEEGAPSIFLNHGFGDGSLWGWVCHLKPVTEEISSAAFTGKARQRFMTSSLLLVDPFSREMHVPPQQVQTRSPVSRMVCVCLVHREAQDQAQPVPRPQKALKRTCGVDGCSVWTDAPCGHYCMTDKCDRCCRHQGVRRDWGRVFFEGESCPLVPQRSELPQIELLEKER